MDIENFKFTCVSSTRGVGPNEIPYYMFEFHSSEEFSKDLSDDDKAFLAVTEGKMYLRVLDPNYFEIGKDYFFGPNVVSANVATAGK